MRFDNRVTNLIQTLYFEVFSNKFIIDTQCNIFLIFFKFISSYLLKEQIFNESFHYLFENRYKRSR